MVIAGGEVSEETVRVWLTKEESLIAEENNVMPGGLFKYARITMIMQYVNFLTLALSHDWKCKYFLLLLPYFNLRYYNYYLS